jgi:hypothetical protein
MQTETTTNLFSARQQRQTTQVSAFALFTRDCAKRTHCGAAHQQMRKTNPSGVASAQRAPTEKSREFRRVFG